jgi:hypothetical protein
VAAAGPGAVHGLVVTAGRFRMTSIITWHLIPLTRGQAVRTGRAGLNANS